MRAAALLLVGCLVLAGCLGGTGPAGPSNTTDDADAANETTGKPVPESPEQTEGARPPTWEVGQWWTYSISLPNGTMATTTFVVAKAEPDKYKVKSDSRSATFENARNPVSFMGHQRRSDLAGSQGEHSVRFFQWPLQEGRTWSTVWDGIERTVNVTAVEEDTFRLVAYDPNGTADVRYTYDPAVEWFTGLTYFDDAGEPTIALTLDDYGLGYNGTVWNLSLATVMTNAWQGGPIGDYATSQGGDAGDDYWVEIAYASPDPAQMGFGYGSEDLPPTPMSPPAVDPFFRATCPCEAATETFTRPADQGATFAGGMAASPQSGATMNVTVLLRQWDAMEV